ncbi:hypothetical protein BT96DRAFT_925259 [Gymnopus androsaceus JB14]|uniref:F-box domain-containing protein n=1 Tax=Gymnopus androsaceus JB14 TaxID=1447944 RepID=A0A6A4H2Z8_9AGAR|nr:hypothetical protein BT96DRAFT_925259 [Gymnopus androsaceus JB14]
MTLSISGITISDRDFIDALYLLPSLTKLTFDDFRTIVHPITSLFLSSLTLHDSDSDSVPEPRSILVPNLCALSIKCHGTSFDDSAFVDAVTSRWLPDPSYTAAIGVASLRSVVLRFREREVDEDVYRGLYELDKVGMRWGRREVNEEADMPLRARSNLERMGMRVVITGKDFMGV